eukprot:g1227.t1
MQHLPNLLGLGVQKSGSTTLAWYMASHPKFALSASKETHFLDGEYQAKDLAIYNQKWNETASKDQIRFEFTPTYIWLPFAACRVKKTFHEMQFVVILRNPVDRAYSEFNMVRSRCRGDDTRCIWRDTDYLNIVKEGLQGLMSSECAFNKGDGTKTWNDCFRCLAHCQKARDVCHNRPFRFRGPDGETSCFPFGEQLISRGLYAAQLAWWFSFFSPENFVIIFSHDFYKDPVGQLNRIIRLVDVEEEFTELMLPKKGQGKRMKGTYEYPDIHKEDAKRLLTDFFYRPNLELYQLLNSTNHRDYTPFVSSLESSTKALDRTKFMEQKITITIYNRKISVRRSVLRNLFSTSKTSGIDFYAVLASILLLVVVWQFLLYCRSNEKE